MTQNIAIIGGGISGLGAAYYLTQALPDTEIHLFEAVKLHGGNADTVYVNLGQLNGNDFIRWADLGVNDVNLPQYPHLKTVMESIGFDTDSNLPKLEDSECYFDQSSGEAYTTDNNESGYVIDTRHSFKLMDNGTLHKLQYLFHETAKYVVTNNLSGCDGTVDDYFLQVERNPQHELTQYSDKLPDPATARQYAEDINWEQDDEIRRQLEWLRTRYYYPRISAMYFADPKGPGQMPLRSPFAYYQLQEGGQTDRRYFRHGSSRWIESLAEYLKSKCPNVHIHTNSPASVQLRDNDATVYVNGVEAGNFDRVIFACHANSARKSIRSDSVYSDREQVEQWLDAITYTTSYACCHTDASVLPRNRNLWRTYNVEIRSQEDSIFPYEIHYVCNRHQNDKENAQYQSPELPVYFVSLTHDPNRITRSAILQRVNDPTSTEAAVSVGGYGDGYAHLFQTEDDGVLARTVFHHNVLDQACLDTQAAVKAWQTSSQRKTGSLLFCAGWSYGAGLQEQCLKQAEALAEVMKKSSQ